MLSNRKNWLIQPKVITLEGGREKGGGGEWIGLWSRSENLNYVNARDNYIQICNKTIQKELHIK